MTQKITLSHDGRVVRLNGILIHDGRDGTRDAAMDHAATVQETIKALGHDAQIITGA